MGKQIHSLTDDPSLGVLANNLTDSWQVLRLLGRENPLLFPFAGLNDGMGPARIGIKHIRSYAVVSCSPFHALRQLNAPRHLSALLCVLSRANDILPQHYTYDRNAKVLIDGVLKKSKTYPHFSAFRNALESQCARVENQLKSRFPMHGLD